MKTVGISTSSICNGIDIFNKQLNHDVVDLRKEAVTGQYADFGIKFGGKVTDILELNQEKQCIAETLNSNNLAKLRCNISNKGLENIERIYNDMLAKTLIIEGDNSSTTINQIQGMIQESLKALTDSANAIHGGEYLFSGINTSEKPFQDYFAKDSPAKKSFNQMLDNFLKSNSKNLPAGQQVEFYSLKTEQMIEFIDQLEKTFLNDDYWMHNWSKASNQNIKYYNNNAEGRDISVNTNMDGIRYFALFSVIGSELLSKDLDPESINAINKKMTSIIGKGLADCNYNNAILGITENKIKEEGLLLQDQQSILETNIGKLVGVDQYKTSIILEELVSKIDISYVITSKIQKLSLLHYI